MDVVYWVLVVLTYGFGAAVFLGALLVVIGSMLTGPRSPFER